MKKKGEIVTNIYIGLCGEFMNGVYLNPYTWDNSCNKISTNKDEVLDHLKTHGGCDTVLLKGKLTITKDNKIKILAIEMIE